MCVCVYVWVARREGVTGRGGAAGLPPPSRVRGEGVGIHQIFFTAKLLHTNQSSFYCPHPPALPHTIAILLHDYCAIYDSPPTSVLYAIHHPILVMALRSG